MSSNTEKKNSKPPKKLIMGYWDCPYCSKKGIEGTSRECPSCGSARAKDTKFYMKRNSRALTKEESKTKGKGADWICSYCETLNSTLDTSCKSCGHTREKNDDDYFSYKKKQRNKTSNTTNNIRKSNNTASKNTENLHNFSFGNIFPILLCILLVVGSVFGIYNLLTPKTVNFHVNNLTWKTSQNVEELVTCNESGWSIPTGGRQTDKQWVIKTYEQVLDH